MNERKYSLKITVQTRYLPEQSKPEDGQYSFAYTINITNSGNVPAQVISRHWIITDATGHTDEVTGPGVVGEQPVLAPGESFSYTSGCPLRTSSGVMRGTYSMVTEGGDHFDVEIAPFALHEPYTVH